jgi:hypothetical protein
MNNLAEYFGTGNGQGGKSGFLYFKSTEVPRSLKKSLEVQEVLRSPGKSREVPRSPEKSEKSKKNV